MDNSVMVKDFNGFTSSVTTLWGKSPKIHMICGNCESYFSHRFHTIECRGRNPKIACPTCNAINRVPIYLNEKKRDNTE